jgi:hypothetical protein
LGAEIATEPTKPDEKFTVMETEAEKPLNTVTGVVAEIDHGGVMLYDAAALPVLAGVKASVAEKLKLPEFTKTSLAVSVKQTLELLGVAIPEAPVPRAFRSLETRRIAAGCAEDTQLVWVIEEIPVGKFDGAVIVTEELYVPLYVT